jgi:ATP-dependent Clp protease protease subunit
MGMYGPTNLTPYIMEERRLNVAQMDVFSRLMMDRIIFLGTGIDDQVANIVTAQLLFLESADPSKDIQIYINSPVEVFTRDWESMTQCRSSSRM